MPLPLALLLDVPHDTARLFGMLWALKLVRFDPAFLLLSRVLHNERQSLASVTMSFVVVVLFVATIVFLVERPHQPDAFGSIPATLWWAVTTVTTTGYGDKVPASLPGRILAGVLMVCGIGLFALWAGILASGFAQELRRSEFLRTWDLVVRLPLFRNLGAPALSEITRLLKVERFPAGAVVVREGQAGDSMYFVAEGEVEVRAKTAQIRLGPGKFFGEMALITGAPRNATIVAVSAGAPLAPRRGRFPRPRRPPAGAFAAYRGGRRAPRRPRARLKGQGAAVLARVRCGEQRAPVAVDDDGLRAADRLAPVHDLVPALRELRGDGLGERRLDAQHALRRKGARRVDRLLRIHTAQQQS